MNLIDRAPCVRYRKLAALMSEHEQALAPERGGGHRARGQGGKRLVAEKRMLALLAARYPAAVSGPRLCGASDWGVLLSLVQRGLVECRDDEAFRFVPRPQEAAAAPPGGGCAHCGGPVPPAANSNGVPKRFCSDRCKCRAATAAWKRRRNQQEAKSDG